jgi:hypothetical protein
MGSAPPAQSSAQNVSCPSQNFGEFILAFAERAELQRRFTHLPLRYGEYDDDFELIRRDITAFDQIPTRSEEGLVFPSKNDQSEGKYSIAMSGGDDEAFGVQAKAPPSLDPGARRVVVQVYISGTGVQFYYHFRKNSDCWYLYSINDKST